MTASIAAVVLAHNEAALLALTLPRIKACVDEVIVVDMGSTDGSRRLYDVFLGRGDRVVTYEQRNLPLFGFAHARNYGARFTRADWILSVDSDEWIDTADAPALREATRGGHDVVEVSRRNYVARPGLNLADLPAILNTAERSEEAHRRLYRNQPDIRWEGLIHEELCDAQGNTWGRSGRAGLVLHHLNQFKPPVLHDEKHRLYAFMILRAFVTPGFRYGMNPHWFTGYVRDHWRDLAGLANQFAVSADLPGYDPAEIERRVDALG